MVEDRGLLSQHPFLLLWDARPQFPCLGDGMGMIKSRGEGEALSTARASKDQ